MSKSRTDWERVKRTEENAPIPYEPEDGPYDPNDEAATAAFFAEATLVKRRRGQRGPQKAPTKQRISIALSPDVLEYYRSTGPGWQARIDATLKETLKKNRVA